ncbi:MAG: hypothetical protein DRJ10_01170 [Bacteroidetes bacterium]|nr:MAG: hypothetical protein DRJ10_01170 [Bacteroidota bacterium]
MKVFEYGWKTGKGKEITNVKHSGLGCIIGTHNGYSIHESLTTIDYDNGEANWNENLTATDFGADAILFCTGSWKCGDGPEKWEWIIVPNKEIVDKAIKRNIAQTGVAHNWRGKNGR